MLINAFSPIKMAINHQAQNMFDVDQYYAEGWSHLTLILLSSPDDNVVSCTQDSVDSCLPITPLKASVSFAESNHINGSAGYSTSNFLRTYSEPQEDEWCGT